MGARVAKGTLAPEKANQTNERKGEPGHHTTGHPDEQVVYGSIARPSLHNSQLGITEDMALACIWEDWFS